MKADFYPKAARRVPNPPVDGGSMNMDGSHKLTLHTTETAPSAFYRTKVYYHIQVRQDPTTGEVLWEQYIPFSRASRALRNGPDPIETNRDGDVHINLAVVGYAKDSPRWSDALLRELAEFVVWAEEEWGIPAEFHYQFGGGEGYGYDGRYRLDPAVYNKAEGVLGHTHAPDTNTHWDPGAIPVDKLTQLIGELKTVATFADVPEDYWAYSAVEWMAAEGLTKGSGTDADGNPLFKPEDPVTRGELAVFLRRFHDRFV